MSAFTKCAGLVAGISTVAVLGVAIAQGQPPNPLITNPAIGAGQQSSHITPMGETGVLTQLDETRTATLTRQPEVAAIAPQPAPEPVAAAPAPGPEPVAAAPAPEPSTTVAMGAGPAEPMPEPVRAPRRDRN